LRSHSKTYSAAGAYSGQEGNGTCQKSGADAALLKHTTYYDLDSAGDWQRSSILRE